MELRDQRLFIDTTIDRVNLLIQNHIWDGVDQSRFREWFKQFEDRDYAFLAACLLDNLIYRSKDQVIALFNVALTNQALLPQGAEDDLDVVRALQGRKDPGIRMVPVISLDLPPTKSGTYMVRLLHKTIGISDKWMIWAENLPRVPSSVKKILLVDDFCGSGDQFTELVGSKLFTEFREKRPDCEMIYIAAAAHASGLEVIQQQQPKIKVITGEVLSKEHHFFDGTILDQYESHDLKSELLNQYQTLTTNMKIGGSVGPYGYCDQALTYAFSHGTPNNTLPIYWFETDAWKSLLDR